MVAGVAMVCQIVLTAVLLINASIALDLDWQQNQADKASERQLAAQRAAAEEQRKLIEKQGEVAKELAQTDKRLAREFVRSGKTAPTPKAVTDATNDASAPAPVDVAKLGTYERFGLTTVPLFLALLVVLALSLAAHSGGSVATEPQLQPQPETTKEGRGTLYRYTPDGQLADVHHDLTKEEAMRKPVVTWRAGVPRRPNLRPPTVRQRDESPRGEFVIPPPELTKTPKTHVSSENKDTDGQQEKTQGDYGDGMKRLRDALKDISFYHPGLSFKADLKPDCVWIRAMVSEHGVQRTTASAKAKLGLLDDAMRMASDDFRARLEQFLKSKGFEI
jgi:hypothetical protein